MRPFVKVLLLTIAVIVPLFVLAQTNAQRQIEEAIAIGNYREAQKMLDEKTSDFISRKQADSLVEYIFITGKLYALGRDGVSANANVERTLSLIRAMQPAAATLRQAYIEAADYYGFRGNNKKAYEHCLTAFRFAERAESTLSELAKIQNNLSTFSQRMGNLPLAREHTANAINFLKKDTDPDYVTLYISQNGMGSMMYYASRLDSAAYYFKEALETLKMAPREPVNQYYRTAIILNNLSGIYNQQGRIREALNAMYEAIKNYERFETTTSDEQKKSTSLTSRFEAMDNLGGVYKGLGDLSRARELLEYSYEEKRKRLPAGNPAVFNSQILLGQLYYAMRENDAAVKLLKEGISNYENSSTPDPLWLGDAYNTMALIYDSKKDTSTALTYYNLADSYYNEGLGGVYDEVYLELLRNKALFLAQIGNAADARKTVERCDRYIADNVQKNSLTAFYQLLNSSAVEYRAGDRATALSHASKSIDLLNEKIRKSESLMDSVKLEVYKPVAILYRARAKHSLMKNPTVSDLKNLLFELNEAIDIIERKKSFVNDPENSRIILSENKELFDFMKMLELELYNLTADARYIDRIMNLQESILYTRIRNRLDNDSIRFAHVPQTIQNEEKRLNTVMNSALKKDVSGRSVKRMFDASDEIQRFRKELRNKYPEYYRLKYESFLSEEKPVEKMVPPAHTLVRYFFVGEVLYVLVADRHFKKIVALNSDELKTLIERVYSQWSNDEIVKEVLFKLYRKLWEPIDPLVKNRNVVVIPDGILFSLNMELLTYEKINSFRDLKTNSLLSKYVFSYGYSMFLLNNKPKGLYNHSFVGFAPGFNESSKQAYQRKVSDPVVIDYSYLNMLPQPFAKSLLKNVTKTFGGRAYIDDECTRKQFISQAGNTHIIHIGTHAVSDNQFPQYSRLIFSKDDAGSADNVMYLHDIYNHDLSSALTVLAACETGRPGYEDGEGMISLAHAFHYAGSESILTGLWKVDEKAISILLEAFYKNLKQGMPKDKALQQAKLSFLENESGRMLAPAYWGGLIIIGDTSPIIIKNPVGSPKMYLLLPIAILFTFLIFRYTKQNRQRKHAQKA